MSESASTAPRRRRWRPSTQLWLALAVFVVSAVALLRSSPSVGVVRDEGVYFEASRRQGAFWSKALRDPGLAFDAKARDRHFAFNWEHPVVMKSAAGVSARLFARAPVLEAKQKPDPWAPEAGAFPLMSERAAMRLPAQLLAALGAALLAFAAWSEARRRRASVVVCATSSILAAVAFLGLPRVAFHASLHTFDVPIAVMTLVVVLAYRRGLHSLRWAIATGVLLGVAIGVKHNALFLGPLLAIHYYGSAWLNRRRGRALTRAQLLPPVLLACALLAPLVAFVSWPWLWTAPVDRLGEYFAFHAKHSYYNMEFGGVNYNRPPMPIAYPFVMSLATVPLLVWVAAAVGLALPDAPAPENDGAPTPGRGPQWLRAGLWPRDFHRYEGWLYAGLAFAFVALIALPSIPIFGGTKHWLTAYPFVALLAARAWSWAWTRAAWPPSLQLPALALVLTPILWATLHGHPYNLSQYAPLAGGARGAAESGLNRGFWGYAAMPLLETPIPAPRAVYLHDLHPLAKKQYEREGLWPSWRGATPERAKAGLLFHEMHMAADEARVIDGVGRQGPVQQVRLDDVPLTSLYVEK